MRFNPLSCGTCSGTERKINALRAQGFNPLSCGTCSGTRSDGQGQCCCRFNPLSCGTCSGTSYLPPATPHRFNPLSCGTCSGTEEGAGEPGRLVSIRCHAGRAPEPAVVLGLQAVRFNPLSCGTCSGTAIGTVFPVSCFNPLSCGTCSGTGQFASLNEIAAVSIRCHAGRAPERILTIRSHWGMSFNPLSCGTCSGTYRSETVLCKGKNSIPAQGKGPLCSLSADPA